MPWQLLPYLEIAKPSLELADKLPAWVIPSDSAKVAAAAFPPAEPIWRPSLWKTVNWKRTQLSPEERSLVLTLARGNQQEGTEKLSLLPPPRQAAVLETTADYLSWRMYARKISKTELDGRSDPLLLLRAKLGPQNTFTGGPEKPLPITKAHESMRGRHIKQLNTAGSAVYRHFRRLTAVHPGKVCVALTGFLVPAYLGRFENAEGVRIFLMQIHFLPDLFIIQNDIVGFTVNPVVKKAHFSGQTGKFFADHGGDFLFKFARGKRGRAAAHHRTARGDGASAVGNIGSGRLAVAYAFLAHAKFPRRYKHHEIGSAVYKAHLAGCRGKKSLQAFIGHR